MKSSETFPPRSTPNSSFWHSQWRSPTPLGSWQTPSPQREDMGEQEILIGGKDSTESWQILLVLYSAMITFLVTVVFLLPRLHFHNHNYYSASVLDFTAAARASDEHLVCEVPTSSQQLAEGRPRKKRIASTIWRWNMCESRWQLTTLKFWRVFSKI